MILKITIKIIILEKYTKENTKILFLLRERKQGKQQQQQKGFIHP